MNGEKELRMFLDWLVTRSWQAGVLVLIVLAVQWVFRRRLTNRWRFALWWIVILRLALPFGPASAISLFNLLRPAQASRAPDAPTSDVSKAQNLRTRIGAPLGSITPVGEPLQPIPAASEPQSVSPTVPLPGQHHISIGALLIPLLMTLWAAGALTLSVVLAAQLYRFQSNLSRAASPPARSLAELLDKCRAEFGVTQRIELLETDAVTSPALYGLWRPRLLLPRGLPANFETWEIRHIFLHELAHVKRGDLWMNWLVAVLQIMHWFNPLLWLGFARLRADRELACDELALMWVGETGGNSYGRTIIKLLEGLTRPRTIPGLVGILEDGRQMRRRISMIAHFRRPGRWSALAMLLLAAVAAATLTDARNRPANATPADNPGPKPAVVLSRLDLSGLVLAHDGNPLAATVYISTAGPKAGTSTICPSCYADCRKRAKADALGVFKIDSLDPDLNFTILVAAKGFQPKYVSDVDPANGSVKIRLNPIASEDAAPGRSLRGRIVNAKGEPVEGAVIEADGVQYADRSVTWGAIVNVNVDPLAVTDEHGEFLITAKRPFAGLSGKVSAHGYADINFNDLPSDKPAELEINKGATVTGRVLAGGKPVAGVSVGVCGTDRRTGHFLGNYEIATDADGRFALMNLPSRSDFYLYGIMTTMKELGAIPLSRIHSTTYGGTTDVGDLIIGPAHRLAGRVIMTNGAAVRSNPRLLIGREDVPDALQITLDNEGYFDTSGIPSEVISLNVSFPGFHLSSKNGSLDPYNPRQLVGRVDRDISNLVLLMDSGPAVRRNENSDLPESALPQNLPLRGTEAVTDHSQEWKISGRVFDRQTHRPIAAFQVMIGEKNEFQRTKWDTAHTIAGKGGNYTAYVGKSAVQPLLMFEADGYLPVSTNAPTRDATDVDMNLTKGSGPSGQVLKPDGLPAANVTVAYLAGDDLGFDDNSGLKDFRNGSNVKRTDANGRFALRPLLDVDSLIIASADGFAIVTVASLATNHLITLGAYGRVSGTLKRTSGPGTNEDLFLIPVIPQLTARNFERHTRTDSAGRFKFDQVPPGHLRLYSREMVSAGAGQFAQERLLEELDAKPGQDLEMTVETTNRPSTAPGGAATITFPGDKRVPGQEIKGTVLSPDGSPAAQTDVGLQLTSQRLGLSKASLSNNVARKEGRLVETGPDGSFTLPMFEQTQLVVAASENGFAEASLEQLKASPQIRLEKWGTVEGTLHIGRNIGAHQQMTLSFSDGVPTALEILNGGTNAGEFTAPQLATPHYFLRTETDDQGHFTFNFVPPGLSDIDRFIGSTGYPVAMVEVKPGETAKIEVGGKGREVMGHVKFTGERPNLTNTTVIEVSTAAGARLREKSSHLRGYEELDAFHQSAEYKERAKEFLLYLAVLSPDGSFHVDDMAPGKYGVYFVTVELGADKKRQYSIYTSAPEFVVPEGGDKDTAPVDCGTIEVTKTTVPSGK